MSPLLKLKIIFKKYRIAFGLVLCSVCFLTSALIYVTQVGELVQEHEDFEQKTTLSDLFNNKTEKTEDFTTIFSIISSRSTPEVMSTTQEDYTNWRLPGNVIPKQYNLLLKPDLSNGTYQGHIKIIFDANEQISNIRFNSQGLQFNRHNIFTSSNNHGEPIFHEDRGIVDIPFSKDIPLGENYLEIKFKGDMKNRIVGLYRSTYINEQGEERYIATSKLEPTYARQAFPCFDEPSYKAKYSVQIIKPKDESYIALSNMDQVGDPEPMPDNETVKVTFNTSVPMSTYLACFIVCDFKFTESIVNASIGKDVLLKVYATPAQRSKTLFALDVAKNVTSYYIDYFGIEYPLPKLDLIAIPDFVSGAMEHWGLVTFRETALLYDEATSSLANKQRVATVVAHELAHMWFGNLVTLKWWNDLWLNEGFATYMQFKATDHILPDWGMMDQFLISQLHSVLQFDASLASHPIVQKVETPDQITEIFDSISYNKGASVLRMLEHAVGPENFQKAITNYLKKYKFSNAVTKNLLDEIQNIVTDFNIIEFMDTWTAQMGFPILNVSKNGQDYTITQKRFLADPENEKLASPSPFGYKWTIPVTYLSGKEEDQKLVWFDKSATDLKITIPNATWVKFNGGQVGYYRVNYDDKMWKDLTANIGAMKISDRANLIEDSFNIANSGLLSYEIPLNLIKYLEAEDSFIVWETVSTQLYEIKKLLVGTPVLEKFKAYIQTLVTPIHENLTWNEKPTDTHLQKLSRATVARLACSMGHQKALNDAEALFKNWLYDNKKISQNIKSAIYYYGMINASAETWDRLFEKFKNETDAQEKIKLMNGLAAIRNADVLKKYIDLAKNESIIRSQDYFGCMQAISENPVGSSLVWDYVRGNWLEIVQRFTLNDRYLGRLIPAITNKFTTPVRLHEMEDFFKRYPDAGAGATARKHALEKVANNIKWVDNYKNQVETWLDKNQI